MYIGIDLGTSGVKLLLVDSNGTVHSSVTKSYDLLIPQPSWTEQDPNLWYQETIAGLQELVKGYEQDIKGISFSGQMHGLVLLDEQDNVLRNALLWNDQRTVDEVEYLNQTIGIKQLLTYTGNIALTGLTAPKVLWVKHNEPDIFRAIDKIMLPKDYILYKLTNVFATDVSDVSGTLYFNPDTKDYSTEMLDILGIKRSQLPTVYESYQVVGTLTEPIAQTLGLSTSVKVIAGGGDQAVGAVGVGIVQGGECSISLGTSGVIFVASETFTIDHKSYLQSYAHANGKYHMMAVMLNAAGAIKWWNESVFESHDYPQYYERVVDSTIQNGLYFLPYLTGERAPINDPYAQGVLYGMQLHHTKKDLDRAVVEGVTFALKDSFELISELGVDIKRIRITGGGAKSDVWAQMIADVMNKEVVKIEIEEGPALGAALLAMVGCKEYKTVEEACSTLITLSTTFVPHQDRVEQYYKKYQEFQKLYPAMKELYRRVS